MTEKHEPVHQQTDCPPHHHRCHATFHGTIDCPDQHLHRKTKTKMLTVECGADDPKPKIAAFIAQPANVTAEVIQVLDLGHKGWLVIFRDYA